MPTVLVTRPAEQAAPWVERLRGAGFDAVALPLIEIEGVADTTALQAAWRELGHDDLVMFVSPNAVLHFFAARPADAAWPPALRAAATGPGSVQALLAAGVPESRCVAPMHAPFDSSSLWERLRDEPWARRRVCIVRGDGGRDEFAQSLRTAGAQVHFVQAYARRAPRWDAAQRAACDRAVAAPREHLWLLSSAEAIGHLGTLAPQARWREAAAIATHPRIAQAAHRLGFGQVLEAAPTFEAVTRAIKLCTPGS